MANIKKKKRLRMRIRKKGGWRPTTTIRRIGGWGKGGWLPSTHVRESGEWLRMRKEAGRQTVTAKGNKVRTSRRKEEGEDLPNESESAGLVATHHKEVEEKYCICTIYIWLIMWCHSPCIIMWQSWKVNVFLNFYLYMHVHVHGIEHIWAQSGQWS